jgi:hypothetical protein
MTTRRARTGWRRLLRNCSSSAVASLSWTLGERPRAQGDSARAVPRQRFLVPRERLAVLCPVPVRGGPLMRGEVFQHLGRVI